jgi:DASS family divalent anion:Na+ symporter
MRVYTAQLRGFTTRHAVSDRHHVRRAIFLAAALLAYFSSLSAGLTHYGTTPGPIYFGADYVSQQKWRQLGLIASVANILIWASVGLVWWKILGWW